MTIPESPFQESQFSSDCLENTDVGERSEKGLSSKPGPTAYLRNFFEIKFSYEKHMAHRRHSENNSHDLIIQLLISSFQYMSLSHVPLFETPRTAAHQASLFFTISQSVLKLMSIESVMPCKLLILCRPLLLPHSIFPSIRIFLNESALHIRWPKFKPS